MRLSRLGTALGWLVPSVALVVVFLAEPARADPPWSDGAKVDDVTIGYNRGGLIVVGPGDVVNAVWSDRRSGRYEIYYDRLPPGGQWAGDVKVAGSSRPEGHILANGLAQDGLGNLHILWEDLGLNISRLAAGSAIWGSAITITTAPIGAGWAGMTADGQGNLYVAWRDLAEGSLMPGIYSAKLAVGSQIWSSPARVDRHQAAQQVPHGGGPSPGTSPTPTPTAMPQPTSTYQTWPVLVADIDGNVYVLWYEMRAGSGDLYSARLPVGATAWEAPLRVNDVPNAATAWSTGSYALAPAPSGDLYAMWMDKRNGGSGPLGPRNDIFAARLALGQASWGPNWQVSLGANSFKEGTSIAADLAGNIYACWRQSHEEALNDGDIYYAKLVQGRTAWTAPLRLSDGERVPMWYYCNLTVDSQGYVHAIWANWKDIRYSRLRGGLGVDPPGLDVLTQAGSSTAVTRTLDLFNLGSGPDLGWIAAITPTVTWLSPTPLSGTTPSRLVLSFDPQGLNAGTYTSTLTLRATSQADPGSLSLPLRLVLGQVRTLFVPAVYQSRATGW